MVKHLRITVEGKAYDVLVEDLTEDAGSTFYQSPSSVTAPRPAPVPSAHEAPVPAPAVRRGPGG